jgi:hypothetical protein
MEETTITLKEGYEAMILMLYEYYKSTESSDLTDVLSGGEYIGDKPADVSFWYMWEDAVSKIKSGYSPKEKNWE